jgi:hypothetical protein
MAATGGRYTQTVPLDPDESYELRGLRQTRRASIAPQESRHRTGRRCLVRRRRPRWNSSARRFRQPYPLSPNEALVSRAFLAGFAAKRVRRGHERRSPLARELVSRDLCHRRPPRPPAPRRSRAAGLPSRRQLLPLFRNRRRLMLVHVEQVWPSTRGLLLHAWLPPRSLNRVALGRRTCARRQKSPKRVDMVKDGRAANA